MSTDAVLLMSRHLSNSTVSLVGQLRAALPDWLDLAVVGFDPERAGTEPISTPGATPGAVSRLGEHTIYGYDDVAALDLPRKIKHAETLPTVVPGNVDWIWLRFAQLHPEYDRIWWLEDDVRFSGDWRELFTTLGKESADLLTTHLHSRAERPDWDWWAENRMPEVAEPDQLMALMPFGRITRAGREAVLAAYGRGWWGHMESFVPTAVATAGLSVLDVRDHYTPTTFRFRPFHTPDDVGQVERDSPGLLWHPVRTERDQIRRRRAHRRSRQAAIDSAATPEQP